ncbi:NADH dehydrogenase [ubiquinone] 1 beta subcomplex subunit 6 [Danio aesculapii]|uniref:NADH dehydrogenase [ubiquinone] 1 beta subcomplex subunit 6 n=1 Tax=Danio aesculapii TaxID=1142201 RepID=UPI0024BFD4E4|nr:NADH dehydrogenase [ubiquinone] 1 beta subcomplex subunit 6 [Danio aesculapii]
MTGYTPDQKLRFEQLVKLRRQWLKDQELSPREPVVAPSTPGRIERFWNRFLEPKTLWRLYTHKAYFAGVTTLKVVLLPAWVLHYYLKYHVSETPYAIGAQKLRLFPGDVILETGEVVPDLPEDSHGHY